MSDRKRPGCCGRGDAFAFWSESAFTTGDGSRPLEAGWCFSFGHDDGYLRIDYCPFCGDEYFNLTPAPLPTPDPLLTRVEVAAPELTFNETVVVNGYSPCP